MVCGECHFATTNPNDHQDVYTCYFDTEYVFHSREQCSHEVERNRMTLEIIGEEARRKRLGGYYLYKKFDLDDFSKEYDFRFLGREKLDLDFSDSASDDCVVCDVQAVEQGQECVAVDSAVLGDINIEELI